MGLLLCVLVACVLGGLVKAHAALVFRWGHAVFSLEVLCESLWAVVSESRCYLRYLHLAALKILLCPFHAYGSYELSWTLACDVDKFLV